MSDIIERIDRGVAGARARFLAAPLMQSLRAGTVSPDLYKAWLRQQFHFTVHTTRFLSVAATRLPYGREALRVRFLKHALEEFGHEEMCRRDLVALGEAPDEVERAVPLPATTALVAFHYFLAERGNPVSLLGTVYTFEGLAEREGGRVAEALQRSGIPDGATTFLAAHAEIDVKHMEEARRMLREHVSDARDERDIIYASVGGYDLYRILFDEIAASARALRLGVAGG